jgi:hypothetical protein
MQGGKAWMFCLRFQQFWIWKCCLFVYDFVNKELTQKLYHQLFYLYIYLFILQYQGLNSGPTPGATLPALFLWWVFSRSGLSNYLPRLALNCVPPISA